MGVAACAVIFRKLSSTPAVGSAHKSQRGLSSQKKVLDQPVGSRKAVEDLIEKARLGLSKSPVVREKHIFVSMGVFAGVFLVLLFLNILSNPSESSSSARVGTSDDALSSLSKTETASQPLSKSVPSSDSSTQMQPSLAALPTQESKDSDSTVKHWVISDRLNRRTCPSIQCGIVGVLFYRDGVSVKEIKDGWARVTDYQKDGCLSSSTTRFVYEGNHDCSEANGFREDGSFAQWVSTQFLSTTKPPDPGLGETGLSKVLSRSNDFRQYKLEFLRATEVLIRSGRCTLEDFKASGGWWKSVSSYRFRPVYFTYCDGDTHATSRIYLDARNGRIFR